MGPRPAPWCEGRCEDGAARHAIIRRAAIEGDDRCPGGQDQLQHGATQPKHRSPRVFGARIGRGRVATSKVAANLRAKMRDVNRRSESPVAIPRTPPPGLAKAVRRDWEIAGRTSGGTWGIRQLRECPREECEGFAIVEEQFEMLGGCAAKARCRAALCCAQRVDHFLLREVLRRVRAVITDVGQGWDEARLEDAGRDLLRTPEWAAVPGASGEAVRVARARERSRTRSAQCSFFLSGARGASTWARAWLLRVRRRKH